MTRIVLIRHGQASFGSVDYDQLSPVGKRQSELTGKRLDRINKPVFVSGTQRRHQQTAAAMGAVGTIVDTGWNEFDYLDVIRALRPDIDCHTALVAAFNGHPSPRKAFQALYRSAFERWTSGEHDSDYTESRGMFCKRILSALSRAVNLGDTVVVVSSGGPISTIVQRALRLDEAAAEDVGEALANTGITTLLVRSDALKLITLNSYAHLEVEDDLVTYR